MGQCNHFRCFLASFIGFSTGWFVSKRLSSSIDEQAALMTRAGATAIELLLGERKTEQSFLTSAIPETIVFRSVHLPSFSIMPEDIDPSFTDAARFDAIRLIIERYAVQSAVLHPCWIQASVYDHLRAWHIPFAIENMDRAKPSGKTAEDVAALMRMHGVPGVLDLQHAYENDIDAGGDGVTLAKQISEIMMASGGITHIHASGENRTTNHALLQHAENREQILEALAWVCERTPAPVILEGELLPDREVGSAEPDGRERSALLARTQEEMQREIEIIADVIRS